MTTLHLLTGFLGVGKTTAITSLLASKPASERWGLIVNEFGEVGIDGALLGDAGGAVAMRELPGGCICCSAGLGFRMTLVLLLREHRPDRVLIEPTGLAATTEIIEGLCEPSLAAATELRSVVVLVDPRHVADERVRAHPVWRDQVGAADVALLSRCDLAGADEVEQARAWLHASEPAKLHVGQSSHGRFDPALLDLARPLAQARRELRHVPHHDHRHHDHAAEPQPGERRLHRGDEVVVCGWVFPPERVFRLAALERWFDAHASALLRAKGALRTDWGWMGFNATPAQRTQAPSSHRRDSRVELLAPAASALDWDTIDADLRACIQT